MKQQILKFLMKYRVSLAWLLILGLFGYTLWRLQAISNPEADPTYLQKQQTQATKLEIKESLRNQLEKLVDTPVNTQPRGLGRPDPFNP